MRSHSFRCLVVAGLVMLLRSIPVAAQTTRIFYRAEDWLATSSETQRRLLTGILRAWEQVAESVEARGPTSEKLLIREREAVHFLEYIQVSPGLTVEQVRQAIQAYAAAHPTDIFSTVADLVGRALDRRCPTPPARSWPRRTFVSRAPGACDSRIKAVQLPIGFHLSPWKTCGL